MSCLTLGVISRLGLGFVEAVALTFDLADLGLWVVLISPLTRLRARL